MIVILYRLEGETRQRRVVLRDDGLPAHFEVLATDAAGGECWLGADTDYESRVMVLSDLLRKLAVDATPEAGTVVRTDVGELS